MAYVPTPAERQELQDIQRYLKSHAANGTTPAEGSFTKVINAASPNVRQHILDNRAFAEHVRHEGGRTAPFEERLTLDESKLDDASRALLNRFDTEEVVAGVHERLGTPVACPSQQSGAPDLRESLTAAFDTHGGE